MSKLKKEVLFIGFTLILIFNACSSSGITNHSFLSDGKYDPSIGDVNPAEELNKVSQSIKLISSIAFYKKYSFPSNANYKLKDINKSILEDFSTSVSTFNRDASGTAIIIDKNENSVLLLSCAHILSFPDTLVSYYSYKSGIKSDYVESIAFKVGQSNYASFTESGEIQIIKMNEEIDGALLLGKTKSASNIDLSIFPYKFGNSSDLEWGTFVFVFGFPLHNKSITTGIISKPEKSNQKFFVLDAAVNRGSSGSPVIALRDGIPNFELVGIISWVPSDKLIYIRPSYLENNQQYQTDSKYAGDLYISETENIRYGITKAVMIDEIKKFILENSELLTRQKFNVDKLLKIINH